MIPYQAVIKSVSKEGLQSSRTNVITIQKFTVYSNLEGSQDEIKYHGEKMLVRILDLDIKVPLFILFRALGIESDKEILSHIIYDSDSDELQRKFMDILRYTIKDSEPIYTQKNAFKMLSLNTKGKEIINIIDILNNNFLPNYGTDYQKKAMFLGYSVRKLLFVFIGTLKEVDRDSYSFKRVDLAGALLRELYRELWGNFQRNVSLKIDNEFKFNFDNIGNDITNIINPSNQSMIFDRSIMDAIVKSFGGVFGTGVSARQGIVQDLNRNSALGTLSHIRRLSTPLPAGSKAVGPRKLHNSQWGFVCPIESPDGSNTGIINHLSIVGSVSFNINESGIIDALR